MEAMWSTRCVGNAAAVVNECPVSVQVPIDKATPETPQYRVIINRSDKTAVFAGDFNHADNQSSTALASLNRTFSGVHVGLEVFNVASELLSPAELCATLKDINAGDPPAPIQILAKNSVQLHSPSGTLSVQAQVLCRCHEL